MDTVIPQDVAIEMDATAPLAQLDEVPQWDSLETILAEIGPIPDIPRYTCPSPPIPNVYLSRCSDD
jgi:hypothetical protein